MMEKKSLWLKILYGIGIMLVVTVLIYKLVSLNAEPVKTETVVEKTAQKTISTNIFVVRDEQYIIKEISGIIVPLIGDGEKIAKDDTFAVVCENAESASAYIEINEITDKLTRYKQLSGQQKINGVADDKFYSEIDLLFVNMLNVVTSGKFEDFDSAAGDVRDKLTSHQIAKDGEIDFSQKISELEEKLTVLEAKNITSQNLAAESSGYFISSVDGCEDTFQFENIKNVTVQEVQNAVSSNQKNTPQNALGKIVKNYNWYLLAVVDNVDSIRFNTGDTKEIFLGQAETNPINVEVFSVSSEKDGKSVIIFECNEMNERYAGLRIEEAKIVTESFKGYKVNSAAVTFNEEGIKGVYVLRGNVISFRKINVLYSLDDYVITEIIENTSMTQTPYNIELYDEVVIDGKDHNDGDIVNR